MTPVYMLQLQEEKIAAIEEKLELSTQKLAQMSSLPEMEEQLKARLEALNQVGVCSIRLLIVVGSCRPYGKVGDGWWNEQRGTVRYC